MINIQLKAKDNRTRKRRVTIEDLECTCEHKIKDLGHYGVYFKPHKNINLGTQIYRYMKIDDLIRSIRDEKLHFSNIQSFEDSRETNRLDYTRENNPPLKPILNYYQRNNVKRIERSLNLCASCWTFDIRVNNQPDESYLMWKAHSGDSGISCRVETTIGNLINCIESERYDLVVSDVIYGDTRELNEYEYTLFHKSIYYDQEQEVRMVILATRSYNSNDKDEKKCEIIEKYDTETKGIDIKIDVAKLFAHPNPEKIFRIIVSPFAKKEDNDNITELMQLCDEKCGINVTLSNVLINKRENEERLPSFEPNCFKSYSSLSFT